MKLNEIKKLLKKLNHISVLMGMAIFCISLSPACSAVLCMTRRMDMARINAYSTVYVAICLIIAILIIGYVVYLLYKLKIEYKGILKLNQQAYEYIEQRNKYRGLKLFRNCLFGGFVLLFLAIPLFNIFTVMRDNPSFIEQNYFACFIIGGISLGIIITGITSYYLLKRVRYEYDHSIPDDIISINRKKKIIRRVLISCIIIIVPLIILVTMRSETWYIQPYISTIPTVPHEDHLIRYDDQKGIYTFVTNKDEEFTILQLTDIHLGGSLFSYGKDIKALKAVYDLVDHVRPDLIIVTGDFVFPLGIQSFSLNNYTPFMQFATFMRNIGIPWAFVYGNHDSEMVASHTAKDLNRMLSKFSYERTGTLLYTSNQPNITGRNNQVINIEDTSGKVIQTLFLLDSNSYASKNFTDYDYIHDDQVEWYKQTVEQLSKEQGNTVPSMIFTHIPLQEYKTAYDLYKDKSDEITYFYGEVGEKGEAICCSNHKSKLFDTIVELNSTKAFFCGHDHYNNISLEYKGVRLTFGMSIDYLAMPSIQKKTKQRGATIITVNQDSSFDVEPIPLTSIQKKRK